MTTLQSTTRLQSVDYSGSGGIVIKISEGRDLTTKSKSAADYQQPGYYGDLS